MATTKLALLVVGVVAYEYGATPPNVRPPPEELREQRGAEVLLPQLSILGKVVTWTWALLEASVLVALDARCPPALAHSILQTLHLPASPSFATPSLAFIAGTALTLFSALLRVHCYRALGRRFTFELAIRPAHALVTHGAYGVVRHPSYVGIVGLFSGWLLCVLDTRGVVVRVGLAALGCGEALGMALLVGVWTVGMSMLALGMHQRMDKEDSMLEEAFGDAWRAWARRVPYRLVPGVY